MKHFLLFILFLSNLYSFDFIKDYISEDNIHFTPASYDEYKTKKIKEFTFKFKIDLENLKEKHSYLAIVSNTNALIYTNFKYETLNNTILIKLDEIKNNELILQYKYEKEKRPEFRWNIISDFEYKYLLKFEGILYGVSYGIIFCAFLYYIIIYFSTRMKYFLYYSLMQFFVLLSLIGFVYFSYQAYPSSTPQMIVDICETLSFMFTLLFCQSILQTKERLVIIHKFLNFFIFLNVLDIIAIFIYKYSILYEYLPFHIGFLVPFFTGMITIYKGDKNAIIYTFGWLIVTIFVYIAEHRIVPISNIYIIHLGAPLESLIFSFALGLMLRNLTKEKNEKEKLLIHQSKLASMGEMINNIAHQWRQPLTHLGFINMNLQLAFEDKPINKKYLNEKIEESYIQLDFMSKTIDNFMDFYKLNKKTELFYISNAVKKALDIMEPIFENHKIKFDFTVIKDKQINSFENEYSQVILNLLTNAKDAIISKKIENPKIKIIIDVENNSSITKISDNAKGIDKKNIEKIFEPYFTTKQAGSGIGLYMSKMIVETHFKGKINVSNLKEGALFSIVI